MPLTLPSRQTLFGKRSARGGVKDRSSEVRKIVPRGVRYDALSIRFGDVEAKGASIEHVSVQSHSCNNKALLTYQTPIAGFVHDRISRVEAQRAEHGDNTVINSKYTLLTFIPLNLWEQFHRPINLYFLIVALLQFISIIAPVSPLSTLLPLLVAFSLTAVKEGFDDYLRHEADKRDNERTYTLIGVHETASTSPPLRVGEGQQQRAPSSAPYYAGPTSGGSGDSNRTSSTTTQSMAVTDTTPSQRDGSSSSAFYFRRKLLSHVKSADICAGDLILLRDGDVVPCDIVTLLSLPSAAEEEEGDAGDDNGLAPEGTVYVSTENLDGENDAKPKLCVLSALHFHYQRALRKIAEDGAIADALTAVAPSDSDDLLGGSPSNKSKRGKVGGGAETDAEEDEELAMERRLEEVIEFVCSPKRIADASTTAACPSSKVTKGSSSPSLVIPTMASLSVECEGPNAFMKQFNGKVIFDAALSSSSSSPIYESIPLDVNNLILASSVVHNTPYLIGMAVYTGHETRVGMTKQFPPLKWARLDQLTSSYSKRVFLLQFVIVLICSIIGGITNKKAAGKSWYLAFTHGSTQDTSVVTGSTDDTNNWVFFAVILPLRFFLLLTVMVPISFKIMVDLSKYYLARTITWDLGLFYDPTAEVDEDDVMDVKPQSSTAPRTSADTSVSSIHKSLPAAAPLSSASAHQPREGIRAVVNNSALAEDLGQIQYVMTDKTGTLTQNKMYLRYTEVVGDDESELYVYQKAEVSPSSPIAATDASADWGLPIHRSSFGQLSHNLRHSAKCSVGHQQMLEVLSLCNTIEAPAPLRGGDDAEVTVAPHQHHAYSSSTSVRMRGGGLSLQKKLSPHASQDHQSGHSMAMDIAHMIVTAIDWSSPSPDETALVKGAGLCGVTVLDRKRKASVVAFGGNLLSAQADGVQRITAIHANKNTYADGVELPAIALNPSNSSTYSHSDIVGYDIVAILPFSSDRGRMSVLVRNQHDGAHTLLTKGADERVLPLATASSKTVHATIAKRLVSYSNSGLRTLVFASRVIPAEEVSAFMASQHAASTADGGDAARRKALAAAYDTIEKNLRIVGITAVEDKLQDGVPATIALLREAGVRVWMLTGDKTETAKRIALSCKLTMPDDDVVDLTFDPQQVGVGVSHVEHMQSKLVAAQSRVRSARLAAASGNGSSTNFGQEMRSSGSLCCLDIQNGSGMAGSGSDTPLIPEGDERASSLGSSGGVGSASSPAKKSLIARCGCALIDAITFNAASSTPIVEVLNPTAILRRYVRGELMPKKGEKGPASGYSTVSNSRSSSAAAISISSPASGLAPVPHNMSTESSSSVNGGGQSIVVNGAAITVLQQNPQLLAAFRPVLLAASTVICCRVTPDQKSLIVRIVKDAGKMTLAIGDGGNDVAMIQEAHVGVGITGYEGKQASKAADFSFGQFRYLSRLMLVHGHMAYQRTAYIVQYSFYKSMIIGFLQVIFNFYTMMSGVSFWNSLALTAYNGVFTVPLTLFYVMDVHAMPKGGLLKHPYLYTISQSGRNLNGFTFLYYVVRGMLQAIIAFYVTKKIFLESHFIANNGFTLDDQGNSMPVYGAIVFVQVLTVLWESHSITWLHWLSLSCSFGSYLLVFIIYSQMEGMDFSKQFDFQCQYVVFYLGFFLTVAFIFGLGYGIVYPFIYYYFPSALQLHRVHALKSDSPAASGGEDGSYTHAATADAVRCPLIPNPPRRPTGNDDAAASRCDAAVNSSGDTIIPDPQHGNDLYSFLRSFKPCL